MKNDTTVEQKSEREVVITRTFNAPARLVFEAWTKPELMRRWWVPKSSGLTLLSCEMDVRTGGGYRFVFKHPVVPGETMAFPRNNTHAWDYRFVDTWGYRSIFSVTFNAQDIVVSKIAQRIEREKGMF